MTKILIVEDEPAIALGLRNDLKLEGYSVEVAGDGETAVSRATKIAFDLILLDVMLPRKDGFSVCRDLRRSGAPGGRTRRVTEQWLPGWKPGDGRRVSSGYVL